MTETTYNRDHFIRRPQNTGRTEELKTKCLLSKREDVLRVWIVNTAVTPDEVLYLPFWKSNGIVVIKDDNVDSLKKICDLRSSEIELYIDDYDFLYENMKSFVVNHRKCFGNVTMVVRSYGES
jgi:hypothetical protein